MPGAYILAAGGAGAKADEPPALNVASRGSFRAAARRSRLVIVLRWRRMDLRRLSPSLGRDVFASTPPRLSRMTGLAISISARWRRFRMMSSTRGARGRAEGGSRERAADGVTLDGKARFSRLSFPR